MSSPPSNISSDRYQWAQKLLDQGMLTTRNYLDQHKLSLAVANPMSLADISDLMTPLEFIERFSRMFEGHPPFLLLVRAASMFPEYSFQLSQNPGGSLPIVVMTKRGQQTLYQAAKEASRFVKKKIGFPQGCDSTLEDLVPDCSDRPYMLDVFQELLSDRKQGVFGFNGYICRVAFLFRDEPAFLRRLNAYLGNSFLQATIVENPDGPSPALVFFPQEDFMEFVSKEGCEELVDRVEHYRSLWQQNCT